MQKFESPEVPTTFSARGLAAYLSIGERSVWRLRDMGALPPPIRIGKRVLWRRADIESWVSNDCRPVRKGGGR